MAFLVPALTSGVSDILLLYLNAKYKGNVASEEKHAIMNTHYMAVLAMIRLSLLFLPLAYHSYTGTAVKCAWFYQMFYSLSIMILLGHALAIIMLDPDSLTSLLPDRGRILKSSNPAVVAIMRHVWMELSLSILSTTMHCLLLWHVRSTAPYPYDANKRRNRVLYYYAQQQQQLQNSSTEIMNAEEHEMMPITGASSPSSSESSHRRRRSNDLMEQVKLIPEGYDEFMSDLNLRLLRARQLWSARLEDFTKKVTHHSSHGRSNSNYGTNNGTTATTTKSNPFFTQQVSPFKVLLQLFAYQEVFANQKLNQAFNVDQGEQMTFYVPQLLSFLLHGAFDNSPQLEAWILEKCKSNVHFAHCCYWFLRAWCLEDEHYGVVTLSRNESDSSLQHERRRSLSNASSVGSSVWSGDDSSGGGLFASGSSSRLFDASPTATQRRASKYYPEERTLIEGLMFRVMECGEVPARDLQYGTQQDEITGANLKNDNDESQTADLAASDVENTVQQYGFTPQGLDRHEPLPAGGCFMETPRFLDALLSIADSLLLVPREKRLPTLKRQLQSLEMEFLPSNSIYLPVHNVYHRVVNISIDDSVAISTKERVPCIVYFEVIDYSVTEKKNSELVQSGNSESPNSSPRLTSQGESADSAAVSSVLNISSHQQTSKKPFSFGPTSNVPERKAIALWQDSWRNPQRHNSLLDKVTNFTQMTVKRFREQHNNDALFWIQNTGSWSDVIQLPFESTGGSNHDLDLEAGLTAQKKEKPSEQVLPSRTKPPLAPAAARLPSDGTNDLEAPITPLPDTTIENTAEMGQWSSPTGPVISKPKRKRTLSELRAERASHNTNGVDGEEVMDALIGIRSNMERFKERDNGSLGESPVYGGSPKTPSTCGETTSARSSSSRRRSRPPPVVFKESFASKQDRIRSSSSLGQHPGWKLLPILIKSNDDLRQEQLASQLIYRMASILARERVPVWLRPYEILALTDTGGVMEAIPDTISLDSLKRNSKDYTTLGNFFLEHYGNLGSDDFADAKACFVESLAAYSMVCFLLQIKDRHNGNILLDNQGHLIHIDFGFFFLSSPGKNSGFESAPFKLTRDFVDLMDGPDSKTFRTFRELCYRTFLSLRRNCHQVILLVEMLSIGNEDLPCFRGRPEDAVRELRERFRLDLNDRACFEYVNALVDESLENWRTRWYDRYQRYCVGVL